MKILRWLISHSLFILLIVAVIYAYMFWGNLLGKDTPAGKAVAYLSNEFVGVEEFVNSIKAKQAQLSEQTSSAQQSSSSELSNTNSTDKTPESVEHQSLATEAVAVEHKTEVASNPVEPPPAVEQQRSESKELESLQSKEVAVENKTELASNQAKPQPVIKQPPVNISYSQNADADKKNALAIIDSKDESKQINEPAIAAVQKINTANKTLFDVDTTDKAAALTVTQSDTDETFVPVEVEKQLSNVDDHGEVIDASQPGGAVRENWITARKAFYQRNYELSEQSYQQVIDSTKNNYDAYGELGNVYFNQGKNKQAASAYFEAAAILVNKGQINRARSLMGLLRQLDNTKATELRHLIESSRS